MGIFIDNYQSTQLSNTEQSILLKLDSQPELLDNNLTQLALELHSSGTSIIRLCQKLGFSGFSEFKFETQKLLSLTSNKYEISFLEELTNFCNFYPQILPQTKCGYLRKKYLNRKPFISPGLKLLNLLLLTSAIS